MTMNQALNTVLKRLHYPVDVMLTCVRRYVAYPLSLRHVEEMVAERGIEVDHSYAPLGDEYLADPHGSGPPIDAVTRTRKLLL
jgi:hypothetical protein